MFTYLLTYLLTDLLTATASTTVLRKSEGSIAGANSEDQDAVDRRQNNKVLRQCPLAIAQQLVHYAIAVSTAVRNRVTKTMSVALLLGNHRRKRSPTSKTSSTSLLLTILG